MSRTYILDDHTPVACDFLAWAGWFEVNERHVALTEIGEYTVSTVFLGLDHRYVYPGPPILFETMVSKKLHRPVWLDIQERCSTWEEAEAQHERVAVRVREFVAAEEEARRAEKRVEGFEL